MSFRPPPTEYKPIASDAVYLDGNELRSYQVEGINWLLWNWINGRNSILADEMGLGKTVQTTIFIQTLYQHYRMKPPFLIVSFIRAGGGL